MRAVSPLRQEGEGEGLGQNGGGCGLGGGCAALVPFFFVVVVWTQHGIRVRAKVDALYREDREIRREVIRIKRKKRKTILRKKAKKRTARAYVPIKGQRSRYE